mmetsp:Transcript_11213/g.21353  ORF Transcript_11213/g.21353 Transcript_11213/m.21353 type:complete len:648 (+) Transcript_11213:99-2042(+)
MERKNEALRGAASGGRADEVRRLVELGANVQAPGLFGYTALHWAADEGHIETLKILVKLGADVGTQNHDAETALHLAAVRGHLETVKVLVELGADVDTQDENGVTALHLAARNGNTGTAKVLVEMRADMGLRDKSGHTALDLAGEEGHTDTVKVLKDLSDARNMQPQDMEPLNEALRRAASGGQLHDLRKFLESGADVHAHDLFGRSALHLAASYGNTEIVKALVALGVDVCTQSRDGRVALQFAAENGHTETVRVLEEAAGTPTVHSQEEVRHPNVVGLDQEHAAPQLGRSFAQWNQQSASQLSQLKVYTYLELTTATDNFSARSKIGEGGFGKVYRGKLQGMPVAIKKLDSESLKGQDELCHELEMLATISHRNLVKLHGWCQKEPCLVYELCDRGSLENCLCRLRWYDRVRVATEVCHALIFLHSRKPDGVTHLNIKPSNVLFDHLWNAKLADVGISKFRCHEGEAHSSTRACAGSHAQFNPDFQAAVQAPSDVYSFGILLLELITGKLIHGGADIRHFVQDSVKSHNALFVDDAAGQWPLEHALAFGRLALDCAAVERSQQPDIERDVLPKLEKLRADCPWMAILCGPDEDLCIVCMEMPNTHAFYPCGHRCVCQSHAEELMASSSLCPTCCAQAIDAIRIYP